MPNGDGDVTVFGAPYSVYVRIVLMALLEKGVSWHLTPVDIFADSDEREAYLALNPFGKIPTVTHGAFELYETRAITRYVDEAFDGPALQPADPVERARMAQVQGIVDSFAYPTLIWDIYVAHTARGKGEGDHHEERLGKALPRATTILVELDRLLGPGPFFGGETPSLADLHLAPVFGYFVTVPEAETLLSGFPTLQTWWATVAERESWRVASAEAASESATP